MKHILITIIAIVSLISCGGAEERKEVYLEKARQSLNAGDLDKARIELKNVLQIDPKNGEAYYQLGKMHEQLQDYRKAYGNYLKAEELSPDLLDNHSKLGRFYLLLMNDAEKAQQKVDLVLSKDPGNVQGLLLKAIIALKAKDMKDAMTIAKAVVADNPAHVEGAIFLASLYLREKNSDEAIKILDAALKVNANNEPLNRLLAATLVSSKNFERAEIIYKEFLERNPDSVSSYNNLANFYIQTENKEKAKEVLRQSIDNKSSDVERILTLMKYIRATQGNEAAITEMKQQIDNNKGLGKLRTALAELYILNDDKASAMDIYENAIKYFPEEAVGVDARIALASLYINDKKYTEAKNILEEVIKISASNPQANFLIAKLALNDKDVEKAIISLRVVTKETPENIEAFVLLANAYQMEGNAEQVRSTFNTAYENNRANADVLLKLAKVQLQRDITVAEKIIDDYNSIKENDYDGLSVKAAILNQKKSFEEANKIATSLMETYPDKPAGYLQSVPYYAQLEDKQKVISILEKGYINVKKDNRQLLTLLSSLQLSQNEFDIVEKRLKAELVAVPDDVELNILLAKVYLVKNDVDVAASVLKSLVAKKPGVEEPYLILSQIYQSKNDTDSVKSILLEGKINVANSLKIPLRLATIYEAEADYAKSITLYRDLNQKNPNNLIVTNNLASMLSDHGNEEDLQLAKSLTVKLEEGGEPVFLDTIGWVYYKLGDYDQSISYLQQVVEKLPEVNIFNYHLGMALYKSGDEISAKAHLTNALANNKKFSGRADAEALLKIIQ